MSFITIHEELWKTSTFKYFIFKHEEIRWNKSDIFPEKMLSFLIGQVNEYPDKAKYYCMMDR